MVHRITLPRVVIGTIPSPMGALGVLAFQVQVYMRQVHMYMCISVNTLCVVGKGPATELRSSARRNHWSDLMGSLGIGGLIFSQKFIQTSGSFSMYSSISIALPPKL